MSLKYTITNDSLTVFLDGKSHTFDQTSVNFKKLRTLLLGDTLDVDAIRKVVTAQELIRNFIPKGWAFDPSNRTFTAHGQAVPSNIGNRILEMVAERDQKALARFWDRLQANPSHRSITQLYDFLNHADIHITDDGYLLAYKAVRSDLKDIHSGTIYNGIGKTITMPRNQISDDPRHPCHEGLHVGAWSYVSDFGRLTNDKRVILLIQVDPKDVVSVPYDHSSAKMRVCEYKVLEKVTGPLSPDDPRITKTKKDTVRGTPSYESYDSDAEDEDYEDEDYENDVEEDDVEEDDVEEDDENDVEEDDDFESWTLADIRRHASSVGFKGASKFPGGKKPLIKALRDFLKK